MMLPSILERQIRRHRLAPTCTGPHARAGVKRAYVTLMLALMLSQTSCSTIDISYDFALQQDFSSYQRYRWHPEDIERTASLDIEGVDRREKKEWIAFSPDSRQLAVLPGGGGEVQFWRVSDGQVSDRLVADTGGFGTKAVSAAWSPDGSLLAVADLSNSLRIVDVRNLRVIEYPTASGDGIHLGLDRGAFRGSVFHPDGNHVAAFADSPHGGSISIWRVSDGQEALRLNDFVDWVVAATFNSDGSQLMAVSRDGTLIVSAISLPSDREVE